MAMRMNNAEAAGVPLPQYTNQGSFVSSTDRSP
jgi:hypothetical protein